MEKFPKIACLPSLYSVFLIETSYFLKVRSGRNSDIERIYKGIFPKNAFFFKKEMK